VVFDSYHPASIARFWAAALDGYEVAPYDEAELERLRANGVFSLDPPLGVDAVTIDLDERVAHRGRG